MKWIPNQNFLPLILQMNIDRDPDVRKAMVNTLASYGDSAHSSIIKLLDDPNDDVINETLNVVRRLNLTIPLIHRKRFRLHPSLKLRVNYATTLMFFATKNPQEYLEEVITYLNDDLAFLQSLAIKTLAELKDPRILAIIPQKLLDPDENIVIKTLEAIATINDTQFLPLVLEKLNDARRMVRKAAVQTIGAFRDRKYWPELFPLLYDNFLDVRQEVYLLFKLLPDQRAILPLLNRFNTAPISEKTEITQIFDLFSIMELILPFAADFRNNSRSDPYIQQRLREQIPNPSSILLLTNISIPQAIDSINDDQTWRAAAAILRGWGFRAQKALQTHLSELKENYEEAYNLLPILSREMQAQLGFEMELIDTIPTLNNADLRQTREQNQDLRNTLSSGMNNEQIQQEFVHYYYRPLPLLSSLKVEIHRIEIILKDIDTRYQISMDQGLSMLL